MTLPSAQALGLVFPIKKEQDGAGLEFMRHFPSEIAMSESQQPPGRGQDVGLPGPGLPRLILLQESRVGCPFWALSLATGGQGGADKFRELCPWAEVLDGKARRKFWVCEEGGSMDRRH